MIRLARWKRMVRNTSASTYMLLEQCPKKWQYVNVQELKAPMNPYAAFGILMHAMEKKFFQIRLTKKGKINIGFTSRKAFVNAGYHWWTKVVSGEWGVRSVGSIPEPIHWESEKQKESFTEPLFIILNKFWSDNALYRDSKALFPQCEVPFKGIKILSSYFGAHCINGIIDRIQPIPSEDGDIIIDYKSGADTPSPDYLRQGPQFLFYHVAYYSLFGKHPVKMKLYPLRYGMDHMVDIPFDRNEEGIVNRMADLSVRLDRFKGKILSVMEPGFYRSHPMPLLVEQEKEMGRFEKRPSDLCFFCEYKERCFADHEHESLSERLAIQQLQDLKENYGVEQLLLALDVPATPSGHVSKKRLYNQIIKKQQKAQLKLL